MCGLHSQTHTPDSLLVKKIDSLIDVSHKLLYTSNTSDSSKQIAAFTLRIAEEANYQQGIGQAYVALANGYGTSGNNSKAIAYYKKAAEIFESESAFQQLANAHYNMGGALYDDGQYEVGLLYTDNALKYFEQVDDRHNISRSLANMSAMMMRLGKPLDSILQKLDRAEKIYREDNDQEQLSHILNNKGFAYLRANQELTEGISYFLQSLELQEREHIDNDFIKGYSYSGLSELYLLRGNYEKSLLSGDSAIIVFTRLDYPYGLKDVYAARVDTYEKQSDFKNAFKAMQVLKGYTDSLYNEKRSSQLNSLRVQYETAQKESEIKDLSQQASIQALEIKQKNQAIIIGVVVILFIIVALYFFYKQLETKKQQSQTELEQRFLRSQLNPHFISNALVSVQSFMLKNDSESAALYLTKFSKLMREILENSRKEFIPVEEEVSMLRNYLDIHKLRLGSFDYSIEIGESIDPEVDTIPPMFVQPFVENAVEHGISNRSEGMINLKFSKEGEYISIEVNDNGKGLTSSKNKDHNSLSSTIIQERMDLFNRSLKKKISLTVNNIKNELDEAVGMHIELKVPFG
ncbi:MAG: histidine kinase [Ekhidna sp.]